MFDTDDQDGGHVRETPRPTVLPLLTALLIVAASISLAVWKVFYEPMDPAEIPVAAVPPPPTPVITAAPTAPAVDRIAPTPVPTTPPPTPAPTPAPTSVPLNMLASAPIQTATAAPTNRLPPARPTRPVERRPASLNRVTPQKVKRGSTTLLDVRGKSLHIENLAFVERDGRRAARIGIPRQRLVDPTLLQVLLVVEPDATKGEYDLRVTDVDGRRSNAVRFEVTP